MKRNNGAGGGNASNNGDGGIDGGGIDGSAASTRSVCADAACASASINGDGGREALCHASGESRNRGGDSGKNKGGVVAAARSSNSSRCS